MRLKAINCSLCKLQRMLPLCYETGNGLFLHFHHQYSDLELQGELPGCLGQISFKNDESGRTAAFTFYSSIYIELFYHFIFH
jgi:hypothetical protein